MKFQDLDREAQHLLINWVGAAVCAFFLCGFMGSCAFVVGSQERMEALEAQKQEECHEAFTCQMTPR